MTTTATISEMPPLLVRARPVIDMTDDEFFAFCRLNPELQIERNAQGEITIIPPAGGETGNRNAELTANLFSWAKENGKGEWQWCRIRLIDRICPAQRRDPLARCCLGSP